MRAKRSDSRAAAAGGTPTMSCLLVAGVLGLAGLLALGVQPPRAGSEEGEAAAVEATGGGEFSDRELSAFAAAYLEVTRLRTSYDARIVMAGDPEEAAELRREVEVQVSRAIRDAGLNREDYGRIFRAFSRDDAVRAKVNRYLVEQPSQP